MLRFSSSVAASLFVVLVACSSDDTPQNANLVNTGTTRLITCNGKTCRGDEFCCGSTGWADAACAPSCGDKHPMECDDATDCPDGTQCCFELEGGNSVVRSQCANVCPFTETSGQLCTTAAADCKNGTCTAIPVAPSNLSQCVLN